MKSKLRKFITKMLEHEKSDRRSITSWSCAGYYAGIRHVCTQLVIVAGLSATPFITQDKHQPLLDEVQCAVKCPECREMNILQPWKVEGVSTITTETHLMLARRLSFQCKSCNARWELVKSKTLRALTQKEIVDARASRVKALNSRVSGQMPPLPPDK